MTKPSKILITSYPDLSLKKTLPTLLADSNVCETEAILGFNVASFLAT